jgi:hypothetical protein
VVSVTPRPRFTPGERTPGTHWIGGWVGLRAGLDAGARRIILCPCRGSNLDRPIVQPVAAQVIKKFSAVYRTQRYITVFIRALRRYITVFIRALRRYIAVFIRALRRYIAVFITALRIEPIMSQMNRVHVLTLYFLNINFNIISPSTPNLQSGSFRFSD